MFLSASGYTSRNQLTSLPKLGEKLEGTVQWNKVRKLTVRTPQILPVADHVNFLL
jgi:hypothetical protein